ncbi:MAG TPA: thiamine-phosphate kinase [Thermoanaerobaculia bacterium]
MKPEDRFVERLRALIPPSPCVLLPPGDDAAVVARAAGPLAATTDMLVEGIDFLPGEDPERLGRRAAAVNLSDLAAVGARPEFFLLSIAFPARLGEEFPLAVARGAIARAGEFGAALIGGDLSGADQTMIAIALWGRPEAEPITRSGACPGDAVYLSGSLGQAAAGLRLARILSAFAEHGSVPTPRFPSLSPADQETLLAAYHDPVPRVSLGLALARHRLATAAIDVSDGLGVDAGRLAAASQTRVVLERDRIPLSKAVRSLAEMESLDPLELALSGGDDYEILFTVPEDATAALEAHRPELGVPVTRIGRVQEGRGAVLRDGGVERDVAGLGHDHFQEARPQERDESGEGA